jgi:hypothetical protein
MNVRTASFIRGEGVCVMATVGMTGAEAIGRASARSTRARAAHQWHDREPS